MTAERLVWQLRSRFFPFSQAQSDGLSHLTPFTTHEKLISSIRGMAAMRAMAAARSAPAMPCRQGLTRGAAAVTARAAPSAWLWPGVAALALNAPRLRRMLRPPPLRRVLWSAWLFAPLAFLTVFDTSGNAVARDVGRCSLIRYCAWKVNQTLGLRRRGGLSRVLRLCLDLHAPLAGRPPDHQWLRRAEWSDRR